MNSHKDEGQVFHDRADHEDTLHLSRTDLFISFNGFLAVAVGLVDDLVIRLVFIGMVLVVNVAWGLWAPNARRFIRALRNAGGHREDEGLWANTVGTRETKYWWINDPLTIVSVYIPWVLTIGWFAIFIYLLFIKR